MIRLVRACLPLVVGSLLAISQQNLPAPAPKSAESQHPQPPQAVSSHKATRHRTHGNHSRRASRKGAKRPEYRPEYTDSSVEVINGAISKKVVFHDERSETASARKGSAAVKTAPAPIKVEVVNGSSTDTQYFYADGRTPSAGAHNDAVVIDVQSSDTHEAGGNKHPALVDVTVAGSQDAKSSSSGAEPVTKQVSPHPKRPDYQPDPH